VTPVDPARPDVLRDEQRFLLESLRDLERERAAGDIDDVDYATLRDGYVARAAAVTREIEGLDSPRTERRPGRRATKVMAALMVLALAIGAGVWVARQSGQRLPGQVSSGGIEQSTAGLLATARTLNFSDPVRAVETYSQVLKLEPDNVEALTYRSWVLALSSRDAAADIKRVALATAVTDMLTAQSIDPNYPDAHCLLGIVYFRFLENAKLAQPQLTVCSDNNPPSEVRDMVTAVLQEVNAALGK
jgi:tetratricopeptide (TPR) repeat protein